MGEVTEEQKNIASKSKIDKRSVLKENNENIKGLSRIDRSSPKKYTSFKEESPIRERNMNGSQL